MRYQKTKSFQKVWDKLPGDRRGRAEEALYRLDKALKGPQKPEGLGLKKLRDRFWEIRAGLGERIIFTLEGDLITFVLIGNHDEVRRFLRGMT